MFYLPFSVLENIRKMKLRLLKKNNFVKLITIYIKIDFINTVYLLVCFYFYKYLTEVGIETPAVMFCCQNELINKVMT